MLEKLNTMLTAARIKYWVSRDFDSKEDYGDVDIIMDRKDAEKLRQIDSFHDQELQCEKNAFHLYGTVIMRIRVFSWVVS